MGSAKGGKKKKKKSEQSIGFQFNDQVSAQGGQTFLSGNVGNLSISQGISAVDLKKLDELFQPFKLQVQQAAPPDKQDQAEEKLQELHAELSKGQNAKADRLNKIIDGLVELVPGALSAVASIFVSPILSALVGPATKLVLDHIKK